MLSNYESYDEPITSITEALMFTKEMAQPNPPDVHVDLHPLVQHGVY